MSVDSGPFHSMVQALVDRFLDGRTFKIDPAQTKTGSWFFNICYGSTIPDVVVEWRPTEHSFIVTGEFDTDSTIAHNNNGVIAAVIVIENRRELNRHSFREA